MLSIENAALLEIPKKPAILWIAGLFIESTTLSMDTFLQKARVALFVDASCKC